MNYDEAMALVEKGGTVTCSGWSAPNIVVRRDDGVSMSITEWRKGPGLMARIDVFRPTLGEINAQWETASFPPPRINGHDFRKVRL